MPKMKKKIYFGYNRFPSDEHKCLEEGCLLGNRLSSAEELRRHIKLAHAQQKPEDQDSGFGTDPDFLQTGRSSGADDTSPAAKPVLDHSSRPPSYDDPRPGSPYLIVDGRLTRTHSMARRFTSVHPALAAMHHSGLDLQVYDRGDTLKVQCQASSLCSVGYSLTLSCAGIDIAVRGTANESASRLCRLPQQLKDQPCWDYQICLYR